MPEDSARQQAGQGYPLPVVFEGLSRDDQEEAPPLEVVLGEKVPGAEPEGLHPRHENGQGRRVDGAEEVVFKDHIVDDDHGNLCP